MTTRDLRRLLQVCREFLARPENERTAFLDASCGDDSALRQEVEALLAEQSGVSGFLNTPAWKPERPLLVAGARLGPYEIKSAIGAGGMGEVYKARDTRLDRDIAIKVLSPEVSTDPERRARFAREAQTVARLSHPNICPLFDVGDYEGTMFLIMEHLAGQTLAERLLKGPLPLDEALTVGKEIAEALSAAHRQGVIHRDLKPSNVMLTKSGAKLLDFGIAKLMGRDDGPSVQTRSASPKQASLTRQGVIVGTPQYMSPEQLEGKASDVRTDLWQLGAILYEMVTGKRAFEGASVVELMSAVIEHEPLPISSLQPAAPPALDRLVRRCLTKDPDQRWDGAHDVADELQWIAQVRHEAAPLLRRGGRGRGSGVWLAGGLLLGAAVAWLLGPSTANVRLDRVSLSVSPADQLNSGSVSRERTAGGSRTALTWTPDGRSLIFVGKRAGVQQLYVRALHADEARPIPHTEGAQAPAVLADGQWVAFWADRAVKKVRLGDGAVMDVAPSVSEPPCGLVWGDGGRLFFGSQDGPIWEIPAERQPFAVTKVGEAELTHVLPWLLPGGRTLLYTVRKRRWTWGDEEVVGQRLDAAGLPTGDRKRLLTGATDARYVPTGHLVFLRQGTLFAVRFDPDSLAVGEEVPVLEHVVQALTGSNALDVTGAGQFAVARTGTLAWVPGAVVPYDEASLVTVDRQGHVSPLAAPAGTYRTVRLAPDHRRLAVTMQDMSARSLWVYDLDRPSTLAPVSRDGEVIHAVWSPDGHNVLFGWLKDGRRSLATLPADGTAPARVVMSGPFFPSSFTPDGRTYVVVRQPRPFHEDIVTVAAGDGMARVQSLIETENAEEWPELSPDGKWLAYASNASGKFEIYVRPYPGPGRTYPVSLGGGVAPAWNPNGRELFYVDGGGHMMAAEFTAGAPPRLPYRVFDLADGVQPSGAPVRGYDVAADGQTFYMVRLRAPQPLAPVTHVNLVLNWFEELKTKAAPR